MVGIGWHAPPTAMGVETERRNHSIAAGNQTGNQHVYTLKFTVIRHRPILSVAHFQSRAFSTRDFAPLKAHRHPGLKDFNTPFAMLVRRAAGRSLASIFLAVVASDQIKEAHFQ